MWAVPRPLFNLTLVPIKSFCVISDVKFNVSDAFLIVFNKTVVWGVGVVIIRFHRSKRYVLCKYSLNSLGYIYIKLFGGVSPSYF